ncbi:MAG: hypothetical protein PHN56_07100 [Candidatus Nanoarchaeia archaeon]|nr:hypothetical protein [Candidatus Nanoarchaeia archaeon]
MNEFLIYNIKQKGLNEINRLKQTQRNIYSEISNNDYNINKISKEIKEIREDYHKENEAFVSTRNRVKIIFSLVELALIIFLTYRIAPKEIGLLLQIPPIYSLGIILFYVLAIFLFLDFTWCSTISSLFLGLILFSYIVSFLTFDNSLFQILILIGFEVLIYFVKRFRFTPIWGLVGLFMVKILLNFTYSYIILSIPLVLIILSVIFFKKIKNLSFYLKKLIGFLFFLNFKTVFDIIFNFELDFNFTLLTKLDDIFYFPLELIKYNWVNLTILVLILIINIIEKILERNLEKVNIL